MVSHWSQWLGDKEPELLVIGQDFANVEYFESHSGRDDPKNKTNENPRRSLQVAGFSVGQPPARDNTGKVYLANAILCMKVGRMNASIKARWIDGCTQNHLLPLASYLGAPFVVGMGTAGWRAARKMFRLSYAPRLICVAAGTTWHGAAGRGVFAVGHCGSLGIANRSWSQQVIDWQRIGDAVTGAFSFRVRTAERKRPAVTTSSFGAYESPSGRST